MNERALRHAYLIITHGSFPILEKLLGFLDSENADFFIHLDAKAGDVDLERFRAIPRRSSVTFVDRIDISWGHFSQVECELGLFRAAAPGHYDYYHLLSGVDVPIKSRAYIESYFRRAPGTNYVNFYSETLPRRYMDRVRYYHPFERWNIRSRALRGGLRLAGYVPQILAGVDRTKKLPPDFRFQKGSNWCSITHELVEYLLRQEPEIRRIFRPCHCPDEMFVQTMLVNSPLRDSILPDVYDLEHRSCLRYIDWERGNPYTFTDGDYQELLQAGPDYLFARKFDCVRYPGVVERLFAHFGEPEEP